MIQSVSLSNGFIYTTRADNEEKTEPCIHVHISNLAAQTGASLFLQINSPPDFSSSGSASTSSGLEERNGWWTYNKTENLSLKYLTSQEAGFTHLVTESSFDTDTDTTRGSEWKLVGIISGFERWSVDWELLGEGGRKGELLRRPWGVLKMVQVEKLWVYELAGWYLWCNCVMTWKMFRCVFIGQSSTYIS